MDDFNKRILEKLNNIEQLIQDQRSLGFGDAGQDRQFIYVKKERTHLWAFIKEDKPITAKSLSGYVVDLYRKEDDVPKLHIVMRTRDAEYVLCSGFETHFSRDVMAAIAQLTPQQAKRPLKVIPTVKEPKPGEAKSNKPQPVYANVLFDDRTLRTFDLKKQFSADELFIKAKLVLEGKAAPRPVAKPPALDSAPPTDMRDRTVGAPSGGGESVEGVKTETVDWKGFCQQYGVLPEVLMALAEELGLPMGKLNPRDSATLYQAAYSNFVRE